MRFTLNHPFQPREKKTLETSKKKRNTPRALEKREYEEKKHEKT